MILYDLKKRNKKRKRKKNWANIIRKHDTISEVILGKVFQEQTAFRRTVIEKRNAGGWISIRRVMFGALSGWQLTSMKTS